MSTKETLLNGLNEDLSAEWGTIMRYTYQKAHAFGLGGAELRSILDDEISDELRHAGFLCDVIVDMGGVPTTSSNSFTKTDNVKTMLSENLQKETEDVASYQQHARIAEELGEIELKVKLEEMAADEERHAREIRRLLKGM
jgi:bacterioferritin